jgi:hypothetical protein
MTGVLVVIVASREALTTPLSERLTFGIYVMAASGAVVLRRQYQPKRRALSSQLF